MKHITTIAFGLGLAAAVGCQAKKDTAPPDDPNAMVCTQDAKICPDGSAVGREGPDCEFAACPGEDGEADPIEAGADAGDGEADAPEDAEPAEDADGEA